MANANAAFAALSEPMRMRIVEQLATRPMSVGELAAGLPVSRPAVSQHLKVLKEAALVAVEAAGTRRVYHVDPAGLGVVRQWLDRHWERALAAYVEEVEREEEE
jgi:DNA-binding transcriptional ArsR family regulator